MRRFGKFTAGAAFLAAGLILGGCSVNRDPATSEDAKREREDKTRDDVARATERAKPVIQDAGRTIGRAAAAAADQAQAAAEGVKEGWRRGGHRAVNINSATESELMELPGVSRRDARKIVITRPYNDKRDLVEKGVLTDEAYDKIRDRIVTK